jgi:hypothetical protein
MMPNDVPEDISDEGGERFRKRLQKKAWRARKFLQNMPDRLECIILCVLGVHVERLMATLQHFDGHNKGLFDAIERSMRNPFIAARSAICKLLRAGRAGVIGIIFD